MFPSTLRGSRRLYMPNDILCMTPTRSLMYMHLISDSQFKMNYHMHDRFEIYFVVSGNVDFFVERNIYIVEPGDLLIINSHEIHKSLWKSSEDYERIIIEFDPFILSPFCQLDYNLLGCFTQRPKGTKNRISLNDEQIQELHRLHNNFEMLGEKKKDGSETLKLLYLAELLVFVNGVFSAAGQADIRMKVPRKIIPILDYIDNNLDANLSLQEIAARFYLDKYYLSRLFMKITGINIHDYILSRRIFKAKELLRDGKSILETSQLSGFENYSTFIRAFKSQVGMLPREYQKDLMLSPQALS
jgi:AraC-like DNA-binding protein